MLFKRRLDPHLLLILSMSKNKCYISTAHVSKKVETPAYIGDKTDPLKINNAAEIQHLFLDGGSIKF